MIAAEKKQNQSTSYVLNVTTTWTTGRMNVPNRTILPSLKIKLKTKRRKCANLIEVITLSAMDNKERIPGNLYRKITAVHHSEVGHMGLQITKDRLNDKTISDRWIKLFIKQCPCCQVMSRAHLAIRTHPFTCAAYYRIEVIALDHIGTLVIDEKGHQYVLVIRIISNQRSYCWWNSQVHIPASG